MAKSKAYRRYLSTNAVPTFLVDKPSTFTKLEYIETVIHEDNISKQIAKPRKKKVAPDAVDVYPKFIIEEEE